ncbi:RagB/SusD family nutrient uptake outer membrane protein [uncultured Salegentibacter sp.]|uniref:RagB/SusD family nutrient uptake outer membrane protein n=1 Tax=uncultured Salegentibacter sp. TaxID=259320 RepID=UPI0030DC7687
MKINRYIKYATLIVVGLMLYSCEDFVEIDTPNNKLVKEEVFNNDATARSAMDGIYNQLFITDLSSGSSSSVTMLSGLSADNIQHISSTPGTRMQFEENEILSDNSSNLWIWTGAYNIIYMTNSLLEGLETTNKISSDLSAQLEGEARFVRAFIYFYLVNLYGDIPLILTTNYSDNQLASRTSKNDVYLQIINDLEVSKTLLPSEYLGGERTQVNQYVATALLARVKLYLEDWDSAIDLSTEVIESSNYELLDDLNNVFVANSREAIWQISPLGGGGFLTHTNEGRNFIIHPDFSFLASIKLRNAFVDTFEEEDLRRLNWIGYHEGENAYFAHKYKIFNSNEFPIEEYSMVLRFAEQYLIRAEANVQKGNLLEAVEDLNIIRTRAGLSSVSEINPSTTAEALLNIIIEERRKEYFTEWGHRWMDLKRTGKASTILPMIKPLWENSDVFYPIPEEELRKNPNLTQNDGY